MKQWMACLLAVMLLCSFGTIGAVAEEQTEGLFTYEVVDGTVTIIGCDWDYDGELVIPETLGGLPVTTIGSTAFSGCDDLTNVVLPNSITTLEPYAFGNCEWLTEFEIPNSVTTIGYAAFDCYMVASDSHPVFSTIDGVLFNKEQTTLLRYPAHLTATTYAIPEGVTTIEKYAFADSAALTTVTIPQSVTSMGEYAFTGSGLTAITIPGSISTIADHAFWICNDLADVTLSQGITTIEANAFQWCDSITSITLPESLKTIGDEAFYGSDGLTVVTIPANVTAIGGAAFGCDMVVSTNNATYSSKDGVLFNKNQTTLVRYPANKKATAYTVPNGVTCIGRSAFSYSSNLNKVVLPKGLTTIDDNAFFLAYGLEEVNIPAGVTAIGSFAFGSTRLKEIHIPNGITEISEWTFSDCSELTTVTIPESVTTIGRQAFGSCGKLTSITIPQGVTVIKDYTFYECSSLTQMVIPGGVTQIENCAFFGCSGLTNVSIPEGVGSIGKKAFFDCNSLKTVTVPAGVTAIGEKAFGYVTEEMDSDEILLSGFVMNCVAGSTAETYCKENGITYKTIVEKESDPATDPSDSTSQLQSTNNTSTQEVDRSSNDENAVQLPETGEVTFVAIATVLCALAADAFMLCKKMKK